ncbi:MAG TPA: type II toxin-antitoxin system RelE/ParE family toxin [Candidatus Thermoplasmatota archaeon]|nr:type II toxin-antitoxin system RelE/ParE family toxin [Candidatus Thermoplasmatota archaeon]
MTTFAIVWSAAAAGTMKKLDGPVRRRIHAKVVQAATDPGRYSIRLVNSPYNRIRVGDFRVIIHIDRRAIQVIVIDVKHRSLAYG